MLGHIINIHLNELLCTKNKMSKINESLKKCINLLVEKREFEVLMSLLRTPRGTVGPKWFMGRARLPVKGARGPSQGKAIAQARWDNLAIQPRTVLFSANPTSHQSEGQKGYRTKLERASKIFRKSCPYCHLILCTWQSRILWLYNHP